MPPGVSYLLLPFGMLHSKRQKLFVASLGLAIAIFAADRLYFGLAPAGPSQAQASTGLRIVSEPTAMLPPEVLKDAPVGPKNALANRLEAVWKDHPLDLTRIKDAFCLSGPWVRQEPAQEEVPVNSDEVRAKEFAQDHQLKAVVVTPRGRIAIIDGTCRTVGQTLDGFRVVSIDKSSVVLMANGVRVTLRLSSGKSKD